MNSVANNKFASTNYAEALLVAYNDLRKNYTKDATIHVCNDFILSRECVIFRGRYDVPRSTERITVRLGDAILLELYPSFGYMTAYLHTSARDALKLSVINFVEILENNTTLKLISIGSFGERITNKGYAILDAEVTNGNKSLISYWFGHYFVNSLKFKQLTYRVSSELVIPPCAATNLCVEVYDRAARGATKKQIRGFLYRRLTSVIADAQKRKSLREAILDEMRIFGEING